MHNYYSNTEEFRGSSSSQQQFSTSSNDLNNQIHLNGSNPSMSNCTQNGNTSSVFNESYTQHQQQQVQIFEPMEEEPRNNLQSNSASEMNNPVESEEKIDYHYFHQQQLLQQQLQQQLLLQQQQQSFQLEQQQQVQQQQPHPQQQQHQQPQQFLQAPQQSNSVRPSIDSEDNHTDCTEVWMNEIFASSSSNLQSQGRPSQDESVFSSCNCDSDPNQLPCFPCCFSEDGVPAQKRYSDTAYTPTSQRYSDSMYQASGNHQYSQKQMQSQQLPQSRHSDTMYSSPSTNKHPSQANDYHSQSVPKRYSDVLSDVQASHRTTMRSHHPHQHSHQHHHHIHHHHNHNNNSNQPKQSSQFASNNNHTKCEHVDNNYLADQQFLMQHYQQFSNESGRNYESYSNSKNNNTLMRNPQSTIMSYSEQVKIEAKMQDDSSSISQNHHYYSSPNQMMNQQQQQQQLQQQQQSFNNNSYNNNNNYQSGQTPSQSQQSPQNSSQQLSEDEIAHLDKKNMVRNLVRAFIRYFLDKARFPLLTQVYFADGNERDTKIQFRQYFTDKKFNNLMLKQLIQHPIYGMIFHQFLQSDSLTYLKHSHIKAKENHQKFIAYLCNCYNEPQKLEQLETYTKTTKK